MKRLFLILFSTFFICLYTNAFVLSASVSDNIAVQRKKTKKADKKYKKATLKKNRETIKKSKNDRKINKLNNNKKENKQKKTKQQKRNIKKIERMEFLDDDKIIALINDQENMVVYKKKINVRVKNKGVPQSCLPKKNITKDEKKQINLELETMKKNLKEHIKQSLIKNDVSKELLEYLMEHLQMIQHTTKKDNEVKQRTTLSWIQQEDIANRAKFGVFYRKMYKDILTDIENLFFIDAELVLTIWSMETNYGTFIGNHDAFNALYSACINADSINRLRYFEENIIALAMLVDRGYFKKDVISSFDGGLGGCQFMPDSFYKFAVSMNGLKADIINNNEDVFASIGNYMHSMGWRYGEGILTEIEMPENSFDKCNVGMNTIKTVGEWKTLGIKLHSSGIGSDYFADDDALASVVITDVDNDNVSDKRAFLVYDNFKVVLGYNQRLAYGIKAGLLFEEIKNGYAKIQE